MKHVKRSFKPACGQYFQICFDVFHRFLQFSGAPARPRRDSKPNTLEILVAHRSQNVWLSHDCPYVRPFTKTKLRE